MKGLMRRRAVSRHVYLVREGGRGEERRGERERERERERGRERERRARVKEMGFASINYKIVYKDIGTLVKKDTGHSWRFSLPLRPCHTPLASVPQSRHHRARKARSCRVLWWTRGNRTP